MPLVLIGRQGPRQVVLAADAAARTAGIRLGMPASKAQALIVGLIVMDAEPEADADALDRLALWALRYSPIVAPDPPDGLVFETAGADHLHGGEAAMLANMADRLREVGVATRIAVADSWGAAHALARFSPRPITIVPPGESGAAVLPLRIAALRLPAEILDSLGQLGFETISDLVDKPRAPLTLRFGQILGRRIDQALGRIGEPIEPVRLEEIVEVRRGFAEPIGAPETIARYAGKLVVELCEQLEKQGLGARRLDLLLNRVDNRTEAIRVGLAQPVRDVRRLTRLLTDKIETIDPGFGIEMMRLAATAAEPLNPTQSVFLAGRACRGRYHRSRRCARQPDRREPALSVAAGGQRRTRTLGSKDCSRQSRHRGDLAGPLASSGAAPGPSRTHRDRGLAARPSAGRLHLARHAAASQTRRRSRAHLRGMVEARCRADSGPRLFPARGRCRRALLGLPRRRRRRCRDRLA